MRQRRTTAPPTRAASRSSASSRKELIAKVKVTEQQSEKNRSALDNHFHRTKALHRPTTLNSMHGNVLHFPVGVVAGERRALGDPRPRG